jgi:hypothetical protein
VDEADDAIADRGDVCRVVGAIDDLHERISSLI